MFIPNRTEKLNNPQYNGLKKKLPKNRENSFSDADGQAAEALIIKIQSGQMETETVNLSEIECHEYLKIRDFPDKDTIDELVNKLRSGQVLPPVILMRDLMRDPESDKLYPLDGDYRVIAKRNLRAEAVEAIVVDCTLRQGLLLRLMLNNSHAKSLTKREKIRSVAKLLKDEFWTICSDREIARYCGSYGSQVAKIRRELAIILSAKNSQIRRIFRRGCAPYYMNIESINSERKSSFSKVDTGATQTINNPPANETLSAGASGIPTAHNAELINQKYNIQPGDVLVMFDRENPNLFYIIYCGDSTDKRFFKIVFSRMKAGLLVADIPWNVDWTAGGHFRDAVAHKLDKLPNDNLSPADYKLFIRKIFSNCAPHLKEGSAFFVFFGLDEIRSVLDAVEDIIDEVRQTIVWYKWDLRQNNGYFKEAHELAFFGWIKGALRYWSGEDSQITVLEEKLLGGEEGELPRSTHPCPKPVSVIRRLIELCLEPDGVVLDPVLGSGTTLLAAAQIGRSGVGVELVPDYVALALDRLMDHFGEDRLQYRKTTIENLPGVLAELEDLKKNAIQNDSEAQIK